MSKTITRAITSASIGAAIGLAVAILLDRSKLSAVSITELLSSWIAISFVFSLTYVIAFTFVPLLATRIMKIHAYHGEQG